MKRIALNVTINKKILEKYKEYCKEKCMVISRRLEKLMVEDMGGQK